MKNVFDQLPHIKFACVEQLRTQNPKIGFMINVR